MDKNLGGQLPMDGRDESSGGGQLTLQYSAREL